MIAWTVENRNKLVTLVKGDPEGSLFISYYTKVCCGGGGATPFPGFLHFTLDPYLIVLKQGIGYLFVWFFFLFFFFKVFGMSLPGIEPPVSQTTGKHSTHSANGQYEIERVMIIIKLSKMNQISALNNP